MAKTVIIDGARTAFGKFGGALSSFTASDLGAAAIKEALDDAGHGESLLDFRITDISGEHYYFKEAALAFGRLDRTKREEFDIWHPADCVGEVGSTLGLIMIGVLKAACEKAYSKGNHILAHLGDDDGKRASMIFSWQES